MDDITTTVISCSSPDEFLPYVNGINKRLDRKLRRRFHNVILRYLMSAGLDDTYKKLNGRSVADILDEADTSSDVGSGRIVAEGEQDGIPFTLYEAPDKPSENDQSQGG